MRPAVFSYHRRTTRTAAERSSERRRSAVNTRCSDKAARLTARTTCHTSGNGRAAPNRFPCNAGTGFCRSVPLRATALPSLIPSSPAPSRHTVRVARPCTIQCFVKKLNDQPCCRKALTAELVTRTAGLDADNTNHPPLLANPCDDSVAFMLQRDRTIFLCKLELDLSAVNLAKRASGAALPAHIPDNAAHLLPGNAELGRRKLPADLLLRCMRCLRNRGRLLRLRRRDRRDRRDGVIVPLFADRAGKNFMHRLKTILVKGRQGSRSVMKNVCQIPA